MGSGRGSARAGATRRSTLATSGHPVSGAPGSKACAARATWCGIPVSARTRPAGTRAVRLTEGSDTPVPATSEASHSRVASTNGRGSTGTGAAAGDAGATGRGMMVHGRVRHAGRTRTPDPAILSPCGCAARRHHPAALSQFFVTAQAHRNGGGEGGRRDPTSEPRTWRGRQDRQGKSGKGRPRTMNEPTRAEPGVA